MAHCPWDDDHEADDLGEHEEPDPADQDADDALVDEDDEDQIVPCPYCGGEMHALADVCPHCRSFVHFEQVAPRRPWWWIIAVIACLAGVLIWVLGTAAF